MTNKKWWAVILIIFLFTSCILISGCGQSKVISSAMMTTCEGAVQVMKAGSGDWVSGTVNTVLNEGDTIKVGTNSQASVTFLDGTTIELKADTWLEITSLEVQESGITLISIRQLVGETISRVVKLVDLESRYEIETVSATATVRGTIMTVFVAPSGLTSVGNEEGKVSVTAQGVEVQVPEGSYSTVLPGQPPSEPEPGVRPGIISTPVFSDDADDLFDENGIFATGEGYLDILTSQMSLMGGLYTVRLELNSPCPVKTEEPTTFIEWDVLIDVDADASSGTKWPLIGNDIGYDYLVRMTLVDTEYRGEILNTHTHTFSDIDFIVAIYNFEEMGNIIELYFPASAIGNPESFIWITAIREYIYGDQPDQPSASDKSPNEGHYIFPPSLEDR
jgi:hypothetical protein